MLPAEQPEPRPAILDDAANACFEITDLSDRGASLIEVARGLLHAGSAARAAELLEAAVRAFQSSDDDFLAMTSFTVMWGVIQDMAGIGDSAGVLQVAGAAPFAGDDFLLLQAASEALREGYLECTSIIFGLISPNFALNNPGALKVLATAAFLEGRDEFFKQSRARITNPHVTAELLIEVGRAAAKRNDQGAAKRFLEEAFGLHREISNEYEREEIVSAVSAAASDCGFYDLALRAVKIMRYRFLRSNGLSTIARNYLRAGRARAAENTISALSTLNETIIHAKERTRVYLELADLLSTAGREPRPALERAWRAALSVDNEIDLLQPLTIAPDERLSIFNDSRRKVEVLADVARSAHELGETELLNQVLDDCCKAAREESDPFDRIKGLSVALGAAVNAGFPVQAEACARDILATSEGCGQDFTLAYVEDAADILISAMPDVAIRLISRALVTSFSARLSFIASKLDARVPGILLGDVAI